jgi:hypothetical protein
VLSRLLIKNIGEFFTGDIAQPQASVHSLLVEDGRIGALDPQETTGADRVLDAGGSAVMPGLDSTQLMSLSISVTFVEPSFTPVIVPVALGCSNASRMAKAILP